jgi:signal transduction histidine kinase
MNIRSKLTLRFISITAVIFLLGSVFIYLFSADYRREDFYSRLQSKANNTAKLLIEVDEVDIDLLHRLEKDNPIGLPDEKIIIYNYRDSLLFSTDENRVINIDSTLLDKIRLEDEVRYMQDNYEVLGFLFKGQYDRFVVIAAARDIYGFRKLQNLLLILAVVFAISIVLISVSGWFYAGKALQPIAKVVNRVDEISITSLNLRVDEGNGQDEIAKLAQRFNSMLSRLEGSFATQKNFISNASHELRTPLTAITGQLEVILLNARSAEEYRNVITSVLDDIKHLNRLSNRLLLLAQTSSVEREKKLSLVRIDEIIWQAQDDLVKHNPTFNIKVDLDESLDDEKMLTIRGDEQLIRTAFSNLMENACKYADDKTCHVFVESSGKDITVQVKDNGIGIPQADLSKIFEPFYRGRNTTNIKGHGIGLSMVRGILKLHDGTIDIQTKEGVGTTITVRLRNLNAEKSLEAIS